MRQTSEPEIGPDTDEQTLYRHVMREMAAAEAGPPVMLQMRPATAFVVLSQMQLAIREPGNSPAVPHAHTVMQAITDHFHQYPALMELIRRGHDPKYDTNDASASLGHGSG